LQQPAAPPPAETAPAAPASTPPAAPSTGAADAAHVESTGADSDPGAASIGASSLADIVAQAKLAAADESSDATEVAAATSSDADLSATEIERVLTSSAGPPLPQSAYAWPARTDTTRANRRWSIAVAIALLALGAQVIHVFRSDIASHPTFGPLIAQAYGALGAEIAPSWDVHQYQIIDWVATAEPNSRGVGSLKITARIQNRGPLRQPYPAVQLRLKDRWEEAVGSRMFTPAEYLPRDTPRGRLMSPGETARAELELVDPGPDAYGFELDVCIEVEASLVTCGTDEVFL
jgi:hypothetical protein